MRVDPAFQLYWLYCIFIAHRPLFRSKLLQNCRVSYSSTNAADIIIPEVDPRRQWTANGRPVMTSSVREVEDGRCWWDRWPETFHGRRDLTTRLHCWYYCDCTLYYCRLHLPHPQHLVTSSLLLLLLLLLIDVLLNYCEDEDDDDGAVVCDLDDVYPATVINIFNYFNSMIQGMQYNTNDIVCTWTIHWYKIVVTLTS